VLAFDLVGCPGADVELRHPDVKLHGPASYRTAIARGRRASLVAAAGCPLGSSRTLLRRSPAPLHCCGIAFQVLGVLYPLYMAGATWRDRRALTISTDAAPRSSRQVIASAVLVNLLNPKLTIFFFAFLPQFVPAGSSGALAHLLALSAIFMAMTFVVFAVYGVFAVGMRTHLIERPRIIAKVRKVFALSFVALGARLATTTQ